MLDVIYFTECRLSKSGGHPGIMLKKSYKSMLEATSAPLAEKTVSAVLKMDEGHLVFCRYFGWTFVKQRVKLSSL